jgi:glycosyltransferase involved in cell wall biosynthesis
MPEALNLVIPCYNEASRLKADPFFHALQASRELAFLFVDDGSTDATPRLLADLAARGNGRMTVLRLNRNVGKAGAVREGVLAALQSRPSYVGFWDADLSTPLNAIPEFMAMFAAHPEVEIVMGSRVKLLGRDVRRSPMRHYSGRVFATAASFALGVAVYDTQCGAKIFRATDSIERVFRRPFQSRWIFDVEILARYLSDRSPEDAESRIYELPLTEWTDVPGSKLKLRHAARAAWDLLRLSRSSGNSLGTD